MQSIGISTSKKEKSERVLLGALLREPYSLHTHISRLNLAALQNASDGLGDCFAEILLQYAQYGKYSAASIGEKTGKDLDTIAATDADIDLDFAIDNWEIEYRRWAMATAYTAGVNAFYDPTKTSIDIFNAANQEAERLAANGAALSSNGHETFLNWGADKLEGKDPKYKTVPFLDTLRDIVPSFKPGELWVIAGRPGMGKTQFAVNLAEHFHDAGAIGLFFSLEMLSESIYRRLLGARHGINPQANWDGLDKKTIWDAITDTATIKDTMSVIDSAYHISEIEAAAVAACYTKKIDYIFVDYLQLVLPAGKHSNRDSEVGSVADALMRLSKKLQVPVIALAQLSRANETRGGSKRPQLSDLRESGRIEQSAYGIIFLHRPEYYGIMEDEQGNSTKDAAEVIVSKHRNGDVGQALAEWNRIRGYRNKNAAQAKYVQNSPTDFTVPASAKPDINENIPF